MSDVKAYGLTGVMARCTGVRRDLRISFKNNYSGYHLYNFKSYITLNGDSYDRYLIRMFEMGESLSIVNQCLKKLTKQSLAGRSGPLAGANQSASLNTAKRKVADTNSDAYRYMEDLIDHFLG